MFSVGNLRPTSSSYSKGKWWKAKTSFALSLSKGEATLPLSAQRQMPIRDGPALLYGAVIQVQVLKAAILRLLPCLRYIDP